jgi:methyl-accepting chemotaxis protein
MRFPTVSLKLKIFGLCCGLSIGFVIVNFFGAYSMMRRASHTGTELQGVFKRYLSFQKALSLGEAAAVDVWASSNRLREAFAKGDDAAAMPLIEDLQKRLKTTLAPDWVVFVDKHGCAFVGDNSPVDPSDITGMRLFADLKSGMSASNVVLEYKKRAYLVAGAPVRQNGEVVGSLAIGERLERVFADFKLASDDDPKKQVELALIDNSETLAAAAHADEWDDLARAVRPEAREISDEGGEKLSLVSLPDGKHEIFHAAQIGYNGPAAGPVGELFLFRNRASREERIKGLVHYNLVIGAIALLAAAIAAFFFSARLIAPIKQFIFATRDLAHGQGDLTQRIDVTRCGGSTETVELADNLNAVFDNLHKLASEVQVASLQVGASSAEISAASKQMLGGATDQASKIESSTAAVTELSSSIQQVAENAMQATKTARESGDRLADGITRLTQTSSLIEETAEKIHALGQSGKRIGNIVEVIRQISEQTSLLALNASIEAAHAGEQGRGFAVVADEVSSLARRVGQSAKDIEVLIATITEQTAEAVTSMQGVTHAFGDHVTGAGANQASLKSIVEVIQDTARSVSEQAVVSDEIARNMDAVQKIAQEVLGSSEEAVVQGEQLHALAVRLEQLVRGFRTEGQRDGGNGEAKLAQISTPPALPEKSSDRRKVARS